MGERRGRGLDLYLLLHALASAAPYDAALPAAVWGRALGMPATPATEAAISRTWSWLDARRLTTSRRRGRLREVRLLHEDGSGKPYEHPGKEGDYLKLSYAYWWGGWHRELDLAAKAVLLIALSLGDDFLLPTDHAAGWYGSPQTPSDAG